MNRVDLENCKASLAKTLQKHELDRTIDVRQTLCDSGMLK